MVSQRQNVGMKNCGKVSCPISLRSNFKNTMKVFNYNGLLGGANNGGYFEICRIIAHFSSTVNYSIILGKEIFTGKTYMSV